MGNGAIRASPEKRYASDAENERLRAENERLRVSNERLTELAGPSRFAMPRKDQALLASDARVQNYFRTTVADARALVETLKSHGVRNTEALSTKIELFCSEANDVQQNVNRYEKRVELQSELLIAEVKKLSEKALAEQEELCAQAEKSKLELSQIENNLDVSHWLKEDVTALTTFEFKVVRADKLRAWSGGPLPRHQELMASLGEGSVETIRLSLGDLVLRSASWKVILVVSHRWLRPGSPDPEGKKQAIVIEHLKSHPEIEYVWEDWWCIPQGRRSEEEQNYFNKTLENIYILFLGAQVLILLDMAYLSRFWTSYEAWLSMRSVSEHGFSPYTETQCRFTIESLGAAGAGAMKDALEETWGPLSIDQAYENLSQEDIIVTNKRDKEQQLQVLQNLQHNLPPLFSLLRQLHLGKELEDVPNDIWSTSGSFLAKLKSGKWVAWGNKAAELEAVQATLHTDGVVQLWHTISAFLAKLKSGRFVSWGGLGKEFTEVQAILEIDGVDQVWSSWLAFFAKLKSGKHVAWGDRSGGADLREVQAILDGDGVDQVWSTSQKFLAKLKSGKFVGWGHLGKTSVDAVKPTLDTIGVNQVWSCAGSFLVELTDGQYISIPPGPDQHGLDLSRLRERLGTDGVDRAFSNRMFLFFKLKSGRHVAWCEYGEDGGEVILGGLQARIDTEGVNRVWHTRYSFLAELKSGKYVAWESPQATRSLENFSAVQPRLDTDGVDQVWTTMSAFVARLKSGKFVSWGHKTNGADLSEVQTMLDTVGLH